MARESRIVPYIDIPIQHASDNVLKRMRRPERQDTIRQKVSLLRSAVPDIAIRTTVVLGFPGETDEDFRVLCDFVEELEFERVGTFTYSEQEGTLVPVPRGAMMVLVSLSWFGSMVLSSLPRGFSRSFSYSAPPATQAPPSTPESSGTAHIEPCGGRALGPSRRATQNGKSFLRGP